MPDPMLPQEPMPVQDPMAQGQPPAVEPDNVLAETFPDKPTPPGFDDLPPERKSLTVDKDEVVQRVLREYRTDLQDRTEWNDRRIQRTAKYRGWREEKKYPWVGASNAHLPVIMTDVQRTEDTLHNAVLSVRPVMTSKARMKGDAEKQMIVDTLLDYQVFVENRGEERIAKLISSYVQDGQFVAFVPYIREEQRVTKVYSAPMPPAGASWDTYIWQALRSYYPQAAVLPTAKKWKYEVAETNKFTGERTVFPVEIVRHHDLVQFICQHDNITFDGPCLLPKELEDVVVPFRAENLQPPSPANPTGAHHVILVDYPTIDEVRRLQEGGFYDLLTKGDLEEITATGSLAQGTAQNDPEGHKRLKDDLEGTQATNRRTEDRPQSFTRLMYFGRADLDGDGLEEDVIYWVLEESQKLCRVRYLTEAYPSNPPRRPLLSAKYLPINERWYAIGLIELMESCYDIIKDTFDQMMDAGHLANMPWGFYRPASNMKPEIMRMGPGDLIPLANPKDDVYYPTLPQGMAAFGQNTIALVMQILDQVTMIGQLQLGGVPQGKSAALRTSQNMQSLLQQGDARPERVLRRFFGGLADVWRQFHVLDKVFLPAEKRIRIQEEVGGEGDPYVTVNSPTDIAGEYDFEFGANILNTNRALAGQATQEMLQVLVNPAFMMMGLVTPQHIHRLLKEWIRSKGQDPRKYTQAPQGQPDDNRPLLTAEDAIIMTMNGKMPYGKAMEPLEEHLATIMQFMQSKYKEYISPEGAKILGQYAAQVQAEIQAKAQQDALMMQMAQAQQSMQGGGKPGPEGQGGPPQTGPAGNPPLSKNEMLAEDLPTSGGGQNGKA